MKTEQMKTKLQSRTIVRMIITIFVGFGIYILTSNFASVAYQICDDIIIRGRLLAFVLQIFSEILCLYLYTKYVMKCNLGYIYIKRPGPQKLWCIVAVLLPLAIILFYIMFVPGDLERDVYTRQEMIGFIISGTLMAGVLPGIAEEMLFRGLMMRSIEEALGKRTAVILSAVLFAAAHFGHIDVFTFKKFVILMFSITVIGVAFALITYQTGSIWSTVVIHAMYNIFGGDNALFYITTEKKFPEIFTYIIHTDNWIFAGIQGSDDMETALPAIIGFIFVLILVGFQYFGKTNKNRKHKS